MSSLDWLLESDPAIRWQALRDLTDAPPEQIAAERARVAKDGWGGTMLSRLQPGGDNREVAKTQRDWVTLETLLLLRAMGVDPAAVAAQDTVARIRDEVTWQGTLPQDAEWHGKPFFAGEVEPCINGRVLAVGAYFGQDMRGLVDRLLTEQMADGGWNCEDDNGSTRGSFHTTINVLEGLLEYERADPYAAEVAAARRRGDEYLVARGLFRRLSTGEVADPVFLELAFPNGYHYDVLRGLDHLRAAGGPPDARIGEALDLVAGKRDAQGRWPLDVRHEDHLDFAMDPGEGQPSRWITVRALRVLRWAGAGG